jgi:hypothetical protein
MGELATLGWLGGVSKEPTNEDGGEDAADGLSQPYNGTFLHPISSLVTVQCVRVCAYVDTGRSTIVHESLMYPLPRWFASIRTATTKSPRAVCSFIDLRVLSAYGSAGCCLLSETCMMDLA